MNISRTVRPSSIVWTLSIRSPAIANHAVPATAGGATMMAMVGWRAAGSGPWFPIRTMSRVVTTTQKKTPVPNDATATSWYPALAETVPPMRPAATVGR
jgi:hypothetical protein